MSTANQAPTSNSNEGKVEQGRRKFLACISIALSTMIGLLVGLPGIGFVLAPVFRKSPRFWRAVGAVDDFEMDATVLVNFEDPSSLPWAGVTAKTGAWVRRVGANEFIAFSINCRHLGCPVRWVAGAELFMCPCHGGVYYKDGTVAAGPPPDALHRYPVRVTGDQVEIETSPIPLTTNG